MKKKQQIFVHTFFIMKTAIQLAFLSFGPKVWKQKNCRSNDNCVILFEIVLWHVEHEQRDNDLKTMSVRCIDL